MKNILFARENTGRYTTFIKMRQAKKNPLVKADAAKTSSVTQAWEMGPSDLQNKISIRVNNCFAQTQKPVGSKNFILSFLENMRYIRNSICTGHRRGWICISVSAGKKIQKIF